MSILSGSGFGIDLICEYIANASFPSHGWTNDAYLICFQFTLCAYNVGACHKKYWSDHVRRACYVDTVTVCPTSIANTLIINLIESSTVNYCSFICLYSNNFYAAFRFLTAIHSVLTTLLVSIPVIQILEGMHVYLYFSFVHYKHVLLMDNECCSLKKFPVM